MVYQRILILFCFCSFWFSPSLAQAPVNNPTNENLDSLSTPITDNRYTLFSLFKGKPGAAALRGLVFPSGGQLYNRKYIKAGIFLAIEGTIIYFAIDRTREFNRLQNGYLDLLNGRIPEFEGVTNPATIRATRDNARKNKDYLWIGFAVGHFLAIAESFVDRHLMDFDVSEDLSFRILPPTTNHNTIGLLSFQYHLSE